MREKYWEDRGVERVRPGSPICTGAPCANGFRCVTFTAASNSADGIGRIVTTRGHLKTPAPTQKRDVCRNETSVTKKLLFI